MKTSVRILSLFVFLLVAGPVQVECRYPFEQVNQSMTQGGFFPIEITDKEGFMGFYNNTHPRTNDPVPDRIVAYIYTGLARAYVALITDKCVHTPIIIDVEKLNPYILKTGVEIAI